VLIGKPPAELSIAPTARYRSTGSPAGVPSALLEHRPEVAAAESLMASANAEIGVAEGRVLPDHHTLLSPLRERQRLLSTINGLQAPSSIRRSWWRKRRSSPMKKPR
jgi:outer membrane protein TolC